jgi:Tfp pilus assembly protein PilF
LGQAEAALRTASDESRAELGPDDRVTLSLQSNLALVHQRQGEFSEAEQLNRDVLSRRRRVLGDDDPDTLFSFNNLGGILLRQRRFNEAEPLLRQAFDGSRRALKDDDEDQLKLKLSAMNNYASLINLRGKRSEAERIFREVLASRERSLGANDSQTIASLYVLASLLRADGRSSEAEPLFKDLYQRSSLAQIAPIEAARYVSNYGACLADLKRYNDAEPLLIEAHGRLEATGQRADPAMGQVISALIKVYTNTNRPDQAEKCRAELRKLQPTTRPASAPATARA